MIMATIFQSLTPARAPKRKKKKSQCKRKRGNNYKITLVKELINSTFLHSLSKNSMVFDGTMSSTN